MFRALPPDTPRPPQFQPELWKNQFLTLPSPLDRSSFQKSFKFDPERRWANVQPKHTTNHTHYSQIQLNYVSMFSTIRQWIRAAWFMVPTMSSGVSMWASGTPNWHPQIPKWHLRKPKCIPDPSRNVMIRDFKVHRCAALASLPKGSEKGANDVAEVGFWESLLLLLMSSGL